MMGNFSIEMPKRKMIKVCNLSTIGFPPMFDMENVVKKKFNLNETVTDLTNDSHRLLYICGISHLDEEGIITGNLRGFLNFLLLIN